MSDQAVKTTKRVPQFRKLARAIDVRRAGLKITNAVLNGSIDPKQANAAVYALNLVQRSLEIDLIEKRLDLLERNANQQTSQPRLVYEAEYSEAS